MDIPPAAPVAKPTPAVGKLAPAEPPKAVAPAPASDPIAQDVTEDVDNLPPPAPKAAPKKEAAPSAPAEDINKKIDDILSGMSLG
jgi:hypothetical protein